MSSGPYPLDMAGQRSLPVAHLTMDLSRSTCGNFMWSLRFVPPSGMEGKPAPVANGFCDQPRERRRLAAELRAVADAVEAWP
ncbi:hypothetical protein [Salipiger abyssi]|uniref:hypothetical protein n=1 Tax=Salipiger abyssi TaxID=1250539 RepID=UPI0012EC8A8D|nr:hypothetical protein [Salipiger abyssi]